MKLPGTSRKHQPIADPLAEIKLELYFVRHGLAEPNPVKGLSKVGVARMEHIGTSLSKDCDSAKTGVILAGKDWPLVESARIISAKLGRNTYSDYIDPMDLFDSPPMMKNIFFERLRSIAESIGIMKFVVVTHEPVIKYLCRVDTVFEGSVTRLRVVSKRRGALPEVTYFAPFHVQLH